MFLDPSPFPYQSPAAWQMLQFVVGTWIAAGSVPPESPQGKAARDVFWLAVIAAWPDRGIEVGDVAHERFWGVPMAGWAYEMWHRYDEHPTVFAYNCRLLASGPIHVFRKAIYKTVKCLTRLWAYTTTPLYFTFTFERRHRFFQRCARIHYTPIDRVD